MSQTKFGLFLVLK